MSIASDILRHTLYITNAKKWAAKSIYTPSRNTGALHPGKFSKNLSVQVADVDGFSLLQVHPANPNGQHIFFLHGGAYVLEPLPAHRAMIERLASGFGFTVHFLRYPLAPEYDFKTTHRVVNHAYQKILQQYPGAPIHLLGDSAGGGLALAFLQTLVQQNILPMPHKTVLLSPWVNLHLDNASTAAPEIKDPILSVPALRHAAARYAGHADFKNPLLSPAYGSKKNLGNLLLLFGTHELFYADLMQLKTELELAQGTVLQTYVGKKMLHDWALLPIPEARTAINHTARWLLGTD